MPNVSDAKEKALRRRLEKLGVTKKDLKETFIRSGGKGGQNVNKVSTCVYLKHLPSGTEVKCARERSRALNRFLARRILADKVEKILFGKIAKEKERAEKIRRQKRKRSKRAKEKILSDKKKISGKKVLRKKISEIE